MKDYKMLCVDIDGTLLNTKRELPQQNIDAIKRVTFENYIPVILVSARQPQAMDDIQVALDNLRPMACFGGALIEQDGEVLYDVTIPNDRVAELLAITAKHDIRAGLYSGREWYVDKMDQWVERDEEITGDKAIVMDNEIVLEKLEKQGRGANKLLCMGEPEKLDLVARELEAYNDGSLRIERSEDIFLEVMNVEASKANAVERIAALYGYAMEDIIAIGDNFNDITMLKAAGLGIAMDNAPQGVKEYADAITSSNDENGVAAAINRYFPVI